VRSSEKGREPLQQQRAQRRCDIWQRGLCFRPSTGVMMSLPRQFALLVLASLAFAQSQEITTEDEPATFQSKVDLVLVPVVVRDTNGEPVDNLHREDFYLKDRGKPQTIARFSVEHPATRAIPVLTPSGEAETSRSARTVEAPAHFVAYLFDDIHLEFLDLVQARDAARRSLARAARPGTRFAVYTTSGATAQDFTDATAKIEQALLRLRPRPIARSLGQECPDVSYYMANLIIEQHDQVALRTLTMQTILCTNGVDPQAAKDMVLAASRRVLSGGEYETRQALLSIGEAIRRLSTMPGERTLVVASPGFLRFSDNLSYESTVGESATRANVVINTLDARGLYSGMPDITKRSSSAAVDVVKDRYDREAARASGDVLAELAEAAGGTFFQNSNDLKAGFDRLSGAPAVYYVLGFSPQELKPDGTFHRVKVTIAGHQGLTVTARRGYYAPNHVLSARDEAKQAIAQAVFSRDEVNDIPVDVQSEFFKTGEAQAHLRIGARLDVRKLHFRRVEDRNADEVMLVCALFDRNGNYLQGVSKLLKMRLRDETLRGGLGKGVSLRSDFDVSSGTYIVRLVVRDAEGKMMATRNAAVEIP
jgi:VWFA-related protein